ncbi:hypothetical protein ACFLTJ_03270 [Chloroflexota bacterium]
MKFGKVAQVVLAIGIFAIAIIFLYRMNLQRETEHEQLNTQLATAQTLLPELVSESEILEERLNQLNVELDQAKTSIAEGKAKFPVWIDNVEYAELFFKIASDRDLEMMSLIGAEPTAIKVEEVTYTVTSYNLEVKGQVADILDFITALAISEEFTTTTVELVDIRVPEPLTKQGKEELAEQELEEGEEEPECPQAIISVDIYSYEGD